MQRLFLSALAICLSTTAAQAQMNNADLKWGPAPPGLPAGAELAVLSGDPTKEGMFTMRLKFPAGFTVPPHHHPADELVTVIEGSMDLGMGDTLDKTKMKALNTGGFALMAKGMNHYATSPGGGIIQVTSQGPFQIIYANKADDPRGAK
jgi:quercetin dioxygenase-like cupin family protein